MTYPRDRPDRRPVPGDVVIVDARNKGRGCLFWCFVIFIVAPVVGFLTITALGLGATAAAN